MAELSNVQWARAFALVAGAQLYPDPVDLFANLTALEDYILNGTDVQDALTPIVGSKGRELEDDELEQTRERAQDARKERKEQRHAERMAAVKGVR